MKELVTKSLSSLGELTQDNASLSSEEALNSLLEECEHAVEQASNIVLLVQMREEAGALGLMLKTRTKSIRIQNRAVLIRLNIERKIGAWINERVTPGRCGGLSHKRKQGWTLAKVKKVVGCKFPWRWQTIAKLSEKDVQAYVNRCDKRDIGASTNGAIRVAANAGVFSRGRKLGQKFIPLDSELQYEKKDTENGRYILRVPEFPSVQVTVYATKKEDIKIAGIIADQIVSSYRKRLLERSRRYKTVRSGNEQKV